MHQAGSGFSLASGAVHVWVARPDQCTTEMLSACARVLSAEDRAHVARFRFERHRREATVSRSLVRTTLARYINRPPSSFSFRYGVHGRPEVDPPCGICFNATNHPGLVACAVSRGEEIGVDTEPLARGEEILDIAPLVFSPPEIIALGALRAAQRRDIAVSMWTCKEAYIKARGLGFAASLQDVVVEVPDRQPPRVRFLNAYDEANGWRFALCDVRDFRVAVAMRQREAIDLLVLESCSAEDVGSARWRFRG